MRLITNLFLTSSRSNTADVQQAGHEPAALLNFVALMGWDHHISSSIPEINSEPGHVTELFTLPGLVEAFELGKVNHKKAAVDVQKLDWLNKMHLRRQAGRLGVDGLLSDEVVVDGEGFVGSREERQDTIRRFEELLAGDEAIKSSCVLSTCGS